MSRESEAKNLLLLDKRTVERNIRKGLITRKDQEKHLKALPDLADNVARNSDAAPAKESAEDAEPGSDSDSDSAE